MKQVFADLPKESEKTAYQKRSRKKEGCFKV